MFSLLSKLDGVYAKVISYLAGLALLLKGAAEVAQGLAGAQDLASFGHALLAVAASQGALDVMAGLGILGLHHSPAPAPAAPADVQPKA